MEDESCRDPIIGLDVGGHRPLFYCHVSTLTNGSSYFASRFAQPDNYSLQSGDYLGKDESGRDKYFVDRSGTLFHYVLEYLRNNTIDLPKFQTNPELWLSLRREAAFFCVDGLLSMLQVTFSCSPSPNPRGDCGILYWLGTDRGKTPYQNPYMSGAVNVGGSVDEDPDNDLVSPWDADMYGHCTYHVFTKATFVQYRQQVEPRGGGFVVVGAAALNWCDESVGKAVTVDLKSVRVRVSNYSIRYGDCQGMNSDWVLAGSINGEQWDVLHEAQSESYIREPDETALQAIRAKLGLPNEFEIDFVLDQRQREVLTNWAEEHCRRTWKVPDPKSNAFYRFFRIQKVGRVGCLHGTSLELFGDVNECPDE